MPRKRGGAGPVNPVTGRLQDYIPRRGDEKPTMGRRPDSAPQKWGGRSLISNWSSLATLGVRKSVTLITTGDIGIPQPVNVQLRFARNDQADTKPGNPVPPFDYPLHGSATQVIVRIRRGVDPSSSPTTDIYNLFVNDVLPIDIITSRFLGVEVEAAGDIGDDDVITWVEAIATPVHEIGAKNQIHPWDVAQNPGFIATSATATTLLGANSDRVQFFIVNTSTNADLLVQLGKGPNDDDPTWLPNPLGTFVLPRNNFFTYESPCPCGFKGTVFGIWSNAGDGGAIIHEGTVY